MGYVSRSGCQSVYEILLNKGIPNKILKDFMKLKREYCYC